MEGQSWESQFVHLTSSECGAVTSFHQRKCGSASILQSIEQWRAQRKENTLLRKWGGGEVACRRKKV